MLVKQTNMVTTAGSKQPSKSNSDIMRSSTSMMSPNFTQTNTKQSLTTTSQPHSPTLTEVPDPYPHLNLKNTHIPPNLLPTAHTPQASEATGAPPILHTTNLRKTLPSMGEDSLPTRNNRTTETTLINLHTSQAQEWLRLSQKSMTLLPYNHIYQDIPSEEDQSSECRPSAPKANIG